ncbi:MAG: hypothetical protein C4567_12960 [Deltaproteobacteria bacterium]|nr:MAG: hypothetical protein C4567_12960 [Deltaproteobacteria bacterium]
MIQKVRGQFDRGEKHTYFLNANIFEKDLFKSIPVPNNAGPTPRFRSGIDHQADFNRSPQIDVK